MFRKWRCCCTRKNDDSPEPSTLTCFKFTFIEIQKQELYEEYIKCHSMPFSLGDQLFEAFLLAMDPTWEDVEAVTCLLIQRHPLDWFQLLL